MVTRTSDDLPWDADDVEGILLTDASFRVAALDEGAAHILTEPNEQNGHSVPVAVLPEHLMTALRNLPVTELSGRTVVLQLRQRQYVCRVAVLTSYMHSPQQPMLVLHLYRDTEVEDTIAQFGKEHDLTKRERQTLIGIANGLTCKEIAEQMDISPNTVKSFLRLLMVKIGVARRGGIISKVLDHHRHRI